jgi:phage terminase large subunit
MEVKLSVEQTRAWEYLEDKETNRCLYGGQAGGGKSFLISLWQIHMRTTYPGTRGYIGRERLKDLKNSILVTFFDVAGMLGLEQGVHYTYNDNKSMIDFENGSRIVLLDLFDYPSDQNWDSLGSTEYTDGAIEEGVHVSKRAADLLLSRTRYKHDVYGLEPKQLITCNPGDSWVKDEIVVPYMEGRLPGSVKFVSASLESNPNKAFRERYKKNLETNLDYFDRQRLLGGDWFVEHRTGGEFYKLFDHKRNVKPCEYNPELPLHVSFDFNVNPYMTMTIWQAVGKDARQIAEICSPSPHNSTPAICKEFIRQYPYHVSGLFIYGDPSGRHEDTRQEKGYNDFRIIQEKLDQYHPSMRVPSKAPAVVMRGKFINAIFEKDYEGITATIDPDCTYTIKDYNNLKEAPDGTKAKIKEKNKQTGVSYEKYGHTSDANDYFLCEYFSKEFDYYQTGRKELVYSIGKRKHSTEKTY